MTTEYKAPSLLEWRCIPDYPSYIVSSAGHVFSTKSNRLLKRRIDRQGYPRVPVYGDGRKHQLMVHHAVCRAFHGP
ncbi:NUMOD4 domain-containing protein [Gordonia insulae]|uniref:NUMOD4 domain-containing protein n=1 Tax=Gordonia insulae TaxID=2420509 RepID=UPI000F5BCA99